MARSSTSRRFPLLVVAFAALVSVAVLAFATPPEPAEAPPGSQIQVAPLAEPPEAPLDVLVPGDMGRALSPFLAILEGDVVDDGDRLSVWNASPTGLGYATEP